MVSNSALLSINSTSWERTLADVMSPQQILHDGISAIKTAKLVSPPSSFLPFLVWEYGLDELTPFVPNLYDLIDQGVDWQRVRGTPSAIIIGLSWIGYSAALEEASTRRNYWNSFQLRFTNLPANDEPDLERIEGIVNLSIPVRSNFRRGVFQYDVGALVADNSQLDGAMLERESGVVITQKETLWSFGRTHEIAHILSEAEGVALGNWIDPVVGGSVTWQDLNIAWSDADFAWNADAATQRTSALSTWFLDKQIYLSFKNGTGDIIGYRRARAVHQVGVVANGAYQHDGVSYAPIEGGTQLYIEAMTQFEDASDVTAETVSLIISPVLTQNVKSGQLWLEPDELSGGAEIALTTMNIEMRKTVREQIKIMLRF